MLSAEEAAQILGLQVRTVRNYVREGRLPGVRIGKQYRIARSDLELFTSSSSGQQALLGVEPPATEHNPAGGSTAEVSSVVQVDGIDPPSSERLQRTVAAVASGDQADSTPLRIEPIYDEGRRRLKLILVGDVARVAELLRVIDALTVGSH